jgi:hypothetical protein
LAGAAAVRDVLGVEAQDGHEFPVGSWLEVRSYAHGNRHTQFERVRVYESDDTTSLRIEMAGGLLFIVRKEWDVKRAPALPPAPLTFDAAYTDQMPDAAALANRLSAAIPGVDWMNLAARIVGDAASTTADPPASTAATAALPAVRFDRAQITAPKVADWLEVVLREPPVGGEPHPWQLALHQRLIGCDVRTFTRFAESLENFLRWGGTLPPMGLHVLNERREDRRRRGVATVAAVVRGQAGLVPWRDGELERRLHLAEWPERPRPPTKLPPLALQLDVVPGGAWGNRLAYSIDRNWGIRGSRCTYDLGTFHVVPLVWQSHAGMDQDKVFTVVYTRARWTPDTDARRAYALAIRAAAMADDAHPLRLTLLDRLSHGGDADRDRGRDELDLDWALRQYEVQEGACYYTGVTLTLSGPIYTTPFVLSFERLNEKLGYTRANTVLIAAEFNVGYEAQMSEYYADLLYGPKR